MFLEDGAVALRDFDDAEGLHATPWFGKAE